MLGISELTTPTEPAMIPQQGERWLKVQLLGELDALGKFQRGVSIFPSLDDEVRFATSQELTSMYPPEGKGFIGIGRLSTSRGHVLRLDIAKLVTRHTAVLRSTGSGKSSTVARIIQAMLAHGFGRANIVVMIPMASIPPRSLATLASSRLTVRVLTRFRFHIGHLGSTIC